MALLAIDRTLNKTWGDSSGAKYRYFYDHRVRALLGDARLDLRLDEVEFPVTICWFPGASHPHEGARKLFVDLNKEARAPSEARLILLSDDELSNIFARGLLNTLRDEDSGHNFLPIYAVEYDNPDARTYQPVRWSVLTNLHLLRYAVLYTVFCPTKFADDMSTVFGGRLPWEEMNQQMRANLGVTSFMQPTVDDGDRVIERTAVADDLFPRSHLPELLDRFIRSWGRGVLHILSDLSPYKAHWTALRELGDDWARGDSIADLAYEALFAGVGMYWTLRDSHEYWRQQVQNARTQGLHEPSKPEIAGAWESLERKKAEFEKRRAHRYLGSETDANTLKSNATFGVFNTHACQLGAILTLTTLARDNGVGDADIPTLARSLCSAWDDALASSVNASRDRRLVFSKDVPKPLNQITKMDTPLAVHFRYYWLELLCLPEAFEHLDGVLDLDRLTQRRDQARINYLHYLIKEQAKALRRANPEWSSTKVEAAAERNALKNLTSALKYWFAMDAETAEEWHRATSVSQSSSPEDQREATEEEEGDLESVGTETENENDVLLRTLLGEGGA
jgi:hypothetical protein